MMLVLDIFLNAHDSLGHPKEEKERLCTFRLGEILLVLRLQKLRNPFGSCLTTLRKFMEVRPLTVPGVGEVHEYRMLLRILEIVGA